MSSQGCVLILLSADLDNELTDGTSVPDEGSMTILGEEDDEVSWEQVDVARRLIIVEDDVLRLIVGSTGAKTFSTGEPADALAALKEDLDVDVGFVRFDRLLILGIGWSVYSVDEEFFASELQALGLHSP